MWLLKVEYPFGTAMLLRFDHIGFKKRHIFTWKFFEMTLDCRSYVAEEHEAYW